MTKPKPPETLAKPGATLWTAIIAKYDLRPDELVTLEDWCALADEIEELRSEWADLGKPRMTKGSMGQLVDHPMPKRITDLRMKRARLAVQLKLPEDGTSTGATNANPARAAAATRWKHGA